MDTLFPARSSSREHFRPFLLPKSLKSWDGEHQEPFLLPEFISGRETVGQRADFCKRSAGLGQTFWELVVDAVFILREWDSSRELGGR